MPSSRKRPPGLSVIAIILALLAVSGVMNAFIWSQLSASLPPDAPAHIRDAVNTLASPVVSASAIFYAITALCAAVGVWAMRDWAPLAILVWGVGVLMLGGAALMLFPQMLDMSSNSLFLACAQLGGIVVAIAILGATWWYVRRKVSQVDL